MSPARRLITLLCPLVLLGAAGVAHGAQDVGTADPSKPITVEVVYPCSATVRGLQMRLIEPVEADEHSLLWCGGRRGTRVIVTDPTPVAAERDRRSRLVIRFHDMEGERRTVTVFGPAPGAREAKVAYGGTRVVSTVDHTVAANDERSDNCPWRPLDAPLDHGALCQAIESRWARTWIVQQVAKKASDFGGELGEKGLTLYVSTWTGDSGAPGLPSWAHAKAPATVGSFTLPPVGEQTFTGVAQLLAYTRWSKFSPGGYKGYLKKLHFPLIFGSLTFSGYGVYGPGDRYGAPTTVYGRNVYIDTLNSDYGLGWRRIMGVLTQPPNGTFCYEITRKGDSNGLKGISKAQRYRLTAIGPGLTPVVVTTVTGPSFPFGAPDYDPRKMQWGTGFSPKQAQALRDQAAMIGPAYRTKPKGAKPKGKGSTDCGATLRQLPESFYTPPPA